MRTYSMRKTNKNAKGKRGKSKISIKNRTGFRLSGLLCCRKLVNRIDERIPFTAAAICYIMLSYSFTMMLCAGIAEVSSDTLTVPSNMLFTRAL